MFWMIAAYAGTYVLASGFIMFLMMIMLEDLPLFERVFGDEDEITMFHAIFGFMFLGPFFFIRLLLIGVYELVKGLPSTGPSIRKFLLSIPFALFGLGKFIKTSLFAGLTPKS